MTAIYEFKCRRCGAIDGTTQSSPEIAQTVVIETVVVGKCVRYGIPTTMVSTHLCKDGGTGVTDFIGVGLKER